MHSSECRLLCEFELPLGRYAYNTARVEVTLDFDANGCLNATAVDKISGVQVTEIMPGRINISREEIEDMVEKANRNRAADNLTRKNMKNILDAT